MALTNATPVTFILTADREKAKPFYCDVLGLRQTGEDEFATTFDLAGTPLRLTTVVGHKPGPHTVLGWNVRDIAATATELKGRGVTFEIYEGFGQDADGIWHAPDRDVKIAWFLDTEGNNLSVMQF